jgi:hypothetical protein
MKRTAGLGVVMVSLALGGLPGTAAADSTAEQVTYGVGSVLGTAVYAPFKATFCILGGITSGFTFPFAGAHTAGRVATAGCGGTWAITPDVLKGREPVTFVGGQSSRSAGSRELKSDRSATPSPQ